MSNDRLTHFDEAGAASMVEIARKPETPRSAVARARLRMKRATMDQIGTGKMGKGDVLGVARLAAISGAKATSSLIPLCHPVRVTGVEIEFSILPALPGVEVRASVFAVDRTGPDMEAMTAAATAALTIYDMCKAVDREMSIESVELLEKTGGKSGHFRRDEPTTQP